MTQMQPWPVPRSQRLERLLPHIKPEPSRARVKANNEKCRFRCFFNSFSTSYRFIAWAIYGSLHIYCCTTFPARVLKSKEWDSSELYELSWRIAVVFAFSEIKKTLALHKQTDWHCVDEKGSANWANWSTFNTKTSIEVSPRESLPLPPPFHVLSSMA